MFVCQIKEKCQDNSNEANSNRLLVVIFSTAAVVFVDVDEFLLSISRKPDI